MLCYVMLCYVMLCHVIYIYYIHTHVCMHMYLCSLGLCQVRYRSSPKTPTEPAWSRLGSGNQRCPCPVEPCITAVAEEGPTLAFQKSLQTKIPSVPAGVRLRRIQVETGSGALIQKLEACKETGYGSSFFPCHSSAQHPNLQASPRKVTHRWQGRSLLLILQAATPKAQVSSHGSDVHATASGVIPVQV